MADPDFSFDFGSVPDGQPSFDFGQTLANDPDGQPVFDFGQPLASVPNDQPSFSLGQHLASVPDDQPSFDFGQPIASVPDDQPSFDFGPLEMLNAAPQDDMGFDRAAMDEIWNRYVVESPPADQDGGEVSSSPIDFDCSFADPDKTKEAEQNSHVAESMAPGALVDPSGPTDAPIADEIPEGVLHQTPQEATVTGSGSTRRQYNFVWNDISQDYARGTAATGTETKPLLAASASNAQKLVLPDEDEPAHLRGNLPGVADVGDDTAIGNEVRKIAYDPTLPPPPFIPVADNTLGVEPQSRSLRSLLPKPLSEVDDAEAAEKDHVTPSPSVTMPAKSVKKELSKKQKPSTSDRKKPAVKVPIHKDELLVSSLDEATKEAVKLMALDNIEDDDRDLVASQPEVWIPRIAKAFDADFLAQPNDHRELTEEGLVEWKRWQTEHENKVWGIFASHDDPSKLAQSCAYIFYDTVLEAHEKGKGLKFVAKTIANGGPNMMLKCSARLNAAITALEQYTIVRYDFLKLERLDGLAASPLGFCTRKVDNMLVNYNKKPNAKPARIDTQVDEAAPDAAKGNRKRKAAAVSDEDDANEPLAGDVGGTQPARKRARAAPKKRTAE